MNRQGIEGIADHLKITSYRSIGHGEHYFVWGEHQTWEYCQDSIDHYPVVEPDNVYNVYDLAEVKIPEGFEFVEFRTVVKDDRVINSFGELETVLYGFIHTMAQDYRRIVVKPVAKKTRRVVVIDEFDMPEFMVHGVTVHDEWFDNALKLNFRIEEREIS